MMEAKSYPANFLLLSLESKFMASAPPGNKRAIREKIKNFPFPFLPISQALSLWFPLLLLKGGKD